ncbi:hypothetical protein [Roseomonas chloroacetimidivorans]
MKPPRPKPPVSPPVTTGSLASVIALPLMAALAVLIGAVVFLVVKP